MSNRKSNLKTTNREKDILEVLWNSDIPLLASDIPKANPSLSISSVQLALRNLLFKNIIEVADIIYSGTVLSRSYRPLIDREEFISLEVINSFQTISIKNIVATLLKHEKNEANTIKELEKLLEERKEVLKKKENKEKE